MKLGDKQELFAQLLSQLIQHGFSKPGYRIRLKELYRTEEQAKIYADKGIGVLNSVHCLGLAIDIVMLHNGEVVKTSEPYEWLGEWWEQQHSLCRWGGRFKRKDGGHFSLEHNGVM